MSEEYTRLVDTLKKGPLQPWQRTDEGETLPDVGKSACLGCLARKAGVWKGLKPYPHTCGEGEHAMMRSALDLHYGTHCRICGARFGPAAPQSLRRPLWCADCATGRRELSSLWPTADGLLGAAALVVVVLAAAALVYAAGASWGTW